MLSFTKTFHFLSIYCRTLYERPVNLKSIFLETPLPKRFCQIFRLFFEQWSFKKNCIWDLLTGSWGLTGAWFTWTCGITSCCFTAGTNGELKWFLRDVFKEVQISKIWQPENYSSLLRKIFKLFWAFMYWVLRETIEGKKILRMRISNLTERLYLLHFE